jgi:hypothetical protein
MCRLHELEHIAMTQNLDVQLTDAERQEMMARAETLGESGMAEAQQAWPRLIAEVSAAMAAGTPPTDPAVVDMGRRWHALVQAATGGDLNVSRKIGEAYQRQPEAMAAQGMDMEMFKYIGAAMASAGLRLM